MTEAELRSLIEACPPGGTVVLPNETIDIAADLSTYGKAVFLKGAGACHDSYGSGPAYGTVLRWVGPAGGTLLRVGGVKGGGLDGLTLDGRGSADCALQVASSWWGTYRDLHVRNGAVVTFDITTVDMGALAEDTQGCLFEKLSVVARQVTSATALRLGSAAPGVGNTSLNNFHDLMVYHYDGAGIQLNDSDGNRFFGGWGARHGSGSGIGIEFNGSTHGWWGHARHNAFYGYQPGPGGVVSRGSGFASPARDNSIWGYSTDNWSPEPTVEPGSTLYWETMGGRDSWITAVTGWDVPSLGHRSAATLQVAVPGAKAGDMIVASLSSLTPGAWSLSGHVVSDGTATVTLLNHTGSTVNLPPGTLRVKVIRA